MNGLRCVNDNDNAQDLSPNSIPFDNRPKEIRKYGRIVGATGKEVLHRLVHLNSKETCGSINEKVNVKKLNLTSPIQTKSCHQNNVKNYSERWKPVLRKT